MNAKVVRIGNGSARVVSVTDKRVHYVDELGEEGFVDLDECAGVEVQKNGAPAATVGGKSRRYIGWRGPLGSGCIPTWVQFSDRRRTRFEFQTCDEMETDLFAGLPRVGCWANDAI